MSLVPVPHPQLSANPALGTPIFPTIFFSLRFFKLRLFITVFLQSERFFDQPPVFCCSNFFFYSQSTLSLFDNQFFATAIIHLYFISPKHFFPQAVIPDVFIKVFLTTTVEELYPVPLFPKPPRTQRQRQQVFFRVLFCKHSNCFS